MGNSWTKWRITVHGLFMDNSFTFIGIWWTIHLFYQWIIHEFTMNNSWFAHCSESRVVQNTAAWQIIFNSPTQQFTSPGPVIFLTLVKVTKISKFVFVTWCWPARYDMFPSCLSISTCTNIWAKKKKNIILFSTMKLGEVWYKWHSETILFLAPSSFLF